MSCYGWEEGTFVLSVTAFRKLATDFYAAHNKLLAQDKSTLERLRDDLIAENKGKRGVDWSQAFEQAMEKTERFSTGYYGQATRKAYRLEVIDEWVAKRMLVESVDPETKRTVFHAPRALKASSFAPKSLRSDPAVHFEEAGVRTH
jgi:hypothetical protein